ncbi:MAG: cysteine hydrolase family protein [Trueperaceae bacterium]|nr:cysteine hydrolase family protein [Trueperaceae bacterium]
MNTDNLHTQAQEYSDFLVDWYNNLETLTLADLDPHKTAFVSVDVIEGFHRIGPLASPRVEAIIPAVVDIVRKVDHYGVPHEQIAFVQDAHPENAQEFDAYPEHCVEGTEQAEAVGELKQLPNWLSYQHFQKNSIASHTSEGFRRWLEARDATTIIAVGDVTDLCLYTLALHLQVRNLAQHLGQRIIVPENCVQTWDAPDHPGDLYHVLFLHQLARNGVEVVKSVG